MIRYFSNSPDTIGSSTIDYTKFINKKVLVIKRGKDGVLYKYISKCINVKRRFPNYTILLRTQGYADIDWVDEVILTNSKSLVSITLYSDQNSPIIHI